MPDILTDDTWSEYLSDEAQKASRLRIRVDVAEARVVDRYREKAAAYDSNLYFDESLANEGPDVVRLDGWEEESDGTPDVDAMPDKLVRHLRIVIAAVVEWRLDREQHDQVSRISQGSRSKTWDNDAPPLPSRLFRPLENFDEREPLSGWW